MEDSRELALSDSQPKKLSKRLLLRMEKNLKEDNLPSNLPDPRKKEAQEPDLTSATMAAVATTEDQDNKEAKSQTASSLEI